MVRLRRMEMLTPERIVEQAEVLHEKYGFNNFKLKGGVLPGFEEMEAVRALKKAFPNGRINIDPNGAWSLKEAIDLCKPRRVSYLTLKIHVVRNLVSPAERSWQNFKNAVNLPVATNMIATDWRQFISFRSIKSGGYCSGRSSFLGI